MKKLFNSDMMKKHTYIWGTICHTNTCIWSQKIESNTLSASSRIWKLKTAISYCCGIALQQACRTI